MDFLDYTEKLYNGDLLQAKLMAILSIILFVAIILIFRGKSMLLKGAILPVFIIAALYGMFGFSQISKHSERLNNITELYQSNPDGAIEQAYNRAVKGIAGYKSVIQKTWPIIMAVGLLLFLFVPKNFIRGIGLGLMVFAFFAIIGDYALQTRLENYLTEIQSFIKLE